ncbi:MAG: hypothetical protein ACRDON_07325 [Gaiellaceae bacterium]
MTRIRELARDGSLPYLAAYAFLAVATYAVMLLPGEPDYADGGGGGWLLVDVLLIFSLARGSRVAWTIACVLSAFGVVVGIVATAVPIPPGIVALVVLQAASLLVLLTRPVRAHVGRIASA